MALPAKILFIDDTYLRKNTAVNDAVDAELIRVAIYTAQDMYVQLSLGTDLYVKLKNEIDAGTLAGVYLTLMQNYVMSATLWFTMVELYPLLFVKHDNGGLHHRTSDDTTNIETNTYLALRDDARSKAAFYDKRLKDYLCVNSSSYPEYSTNQPPDISPSGKEYLTNTGFSNAPRRSGGSIDPIFDPTK